MAVRVLGVHGIGNHRPGRTATDAAAALAERWSEALLQGCGPDHSFGFDLSCAYYADRLRVPVGQGPADDIGPLPVGGEELVRLWAADLGVEVAATPQGHATIPLRILVDRMAERSTVGVAVVRRVVGTFVREVEAYLRSASSPARDESRQVVVDALREHRPAIVIAHSLGSVVAYEALWAAPDVEVATFVTLGSPLGMNEVVYQRLVPTPGGPPGERPPNVRRWVNVADVGDFVAVPRPITKRFAPDVQREIAIDPIDFHTARSYLSARRTVEAMLER